MTKPHPISKTPTSAEQKAAGWTHFHDEGPCDPLLHLDPAMPRQFKPCPGGRELRPCRGSCESPCLPGYSHNQFGLCRCFYADTAPSLDPSGRIEAGYDTQAGY